MSAFPFPLPLILDGGLGTHLMSAGMPAGVCAEQWVIEHPEVVAELQRGYVAAGSNAVYAATFGANRAKLESYGLGGQVREINRQLVAISREAVGKDILIGGDMSPTGLFIEPYGEASFEQIVDIYREQAQALAEAGVDFLGFETMLSLWECRAGVIAARDLGLPIFVTITVDDNCRTLMGATLPACAVALQSLGAAAVGVNCSEGPEGLAEAFYRASVCARVPLIAKPNAGRPIAGQPGKFTLTATQFADGMAELAAAGATIFGGCCGTGPEHIDAIRHLRGRSIRPDDADVCANEGNVFFLHEHAGLMLSEPLACSYSLEDDLIDLEDERVNVAVVRVETEEDAHLLSEQAGAARLPIAIACDSGEVLELALRLFHGRAIVDGRSEIDPSELERIAALYGAIVY